MASVYLPHLARLLAGLALLVASCQIVPPDNVLVCQGPEDCPRDYRCELERCRRPGSSSAAPQLDADTPDATLQGNPDSAVPDPSSALDAGPPAESIAFGAPCSEPLRRACVAHASSDKLICLDGSWKFNGTCDGNTRCDTREGPSLGTCQTIAALCVGKQPGAAVCDGEARVRCDADLLAYEPAACVEHAHCTAPKDSSARCVCDDGYELQPDGRCTSVDDCAPGACAPGSCSDGHKAYTCKCPSGYKAANGGCANIDDCPVAVCAPGTCVDGVNAYACSCPAGYKDDSGHCVNVDDCAPGACAPGTCVDAVQAFSCSCPAGYTAAGPACVDINECATNNAGCDLQRSCTNLVGSFECGPCPICTQLVGQVCEAVCSFG